MMTTESNIPLSLRMPAEWDSRFTAVLVTWPHAESDWEYMLAEVDKCYHSLVEALLKAEQTVLIATPEPERVNALIADLSALNRVKVAYCLTNDTWTRDYGQLTVERSDSSLMAVAYQFNGWGLKFAADKDNKAVLSMIATGDLKMPIVNRKNYVLEGGSIESDGRGTILTTSECMLSINRNGFLKKADVERELAASLGAKRVLWLDYGALAGDDTDSHVDTLARFAPHDTILYVKSYNPADSHTDDLNRMEEQLKQFRTEEGNPYNLIGLPLPDAIYDEENQDRLPATYANFLITPKAVLMPTYNQPRNDEMAKQMLQIAFPEHEILTVDCRALIRQHGSLHCATMQFPGEWISE
jgi:agmatine/peptidylarginine deiminase